MWTKSCNVLNYDKLESIYGGGGKTSTGKVLFLEKDNVEIAGANLLIR